MATIGKIDPFNDTEEDWPSYVERLEMFFMVNNVEDEKRTVALVSLIGGRTYGLLKSPTAPEAPSSFTFTQLTDLLRNHFNPKPLVIAERFRFYKSNQLEETVSQYAADLRRLARHCEFGTFLPDALRDRCVCGLANVHIQKKLLAEDELTFDKAVAIAVAMETATIEGCGGIAGSEVVSSNITTQSIKFNRNRLGSFLVLFRGSVVIDVEEIMPQMNFRSKMLNVTIVRRRNM